MKSDAQAEILADLKQRKVVSRNYLRTLSIEEKIEKLAELQEQYYSMLQSREESGGKPIPAEWQKWFRARHR
jgi:hypothetical protein